MKLDGSVISAASGTERAMRSPSFSTLAVPVRDTRSVAGESAGGGLANNASRQRSLTTDKAVEIVADFLNDWSYCPMSRPGDGVARYQGLREAARQLVATLEASGD